MAKPEIAVEPGRWSIGLSVVTKSVCPSVGQCFYYRQRFPVLALDDGNCRGPDESSTVHMDGAHLPWREWTPVSVT